MFREKKKWMDYTYYSRNPVSHWRTTHLYSPVWIENKLSVRVPFSTMTVDISKDDFLTRWSASTRTKVNRAARVGLVVDRGVYLLKDILKLFSLTAEKKELRGFTPSDFDTFPKFECSAIILNGTMLCGHVWLLDDDEKRAMLYISTTNHRNENDDTALTGRAHYFLLWQDGLFLREKGIVIMDLQGYNPASKDPKLIGVYTWKAGTHGQQEMLYHYFPIWFHLLRKFRNLVNI
jgi:hypothetical protein